MEELDFLLSKGRKLVILEDIILDISSYMFDHPGGAQVFLQNIGKDVSKYFYGGYALKSQLEGPLSKEEVL